MTKKADLPMSTVVIMVVAVLVAVAIISYITIFSN